MARRTNIHFLPGISEQMNDQPVDGAHKSSLARPAAPLPEQSGDLLDARMSEELEAMKRWIESVDYTLARDPILRSRYAAELQTLQRLAKTAGALGGLVAVADKVAAAQLLTDLELKARLCRRPMISPFQAKH